MPPVVTPVAKSHVSHVERPAHHARVKTRDDPRHGDLLRGEGRRVFLDAEHFFDGYTTDRAYALEAVRRGRIRR